jgi:ketosteroid isomerase-like protein
MGAASQDSPEIRVVREYFEVIDGRSPADVRAVLTSDVEISMPGYGTVHGAEFMARCIEASRAYQSLHHVDTLSILQAGLTVVVEGTTEGVSSDGRAWDGRTGASGRFCNVFEFEGDHVRRLAIYLDPDFGAADLPVPAEWRAIRHGGEKS